MEKSQSLAFFFKQALTRRGEKRDFKGGKGAPKARALRLEALEERELLSVNPAEYSALREAYDQIALPESLDDVNVIELPEITAEALQAREDILEQKNVDLLQTIIDRYLDRS